MRVLSAYDLLLADPLKGMNQFDIVHIDNMDKVNSVLAVLGFDIDKPIHIYAAQHRRLNGEVKIGYLFSGEMNLKREFIKGAYSLPDDFLVAAYTQDRGLYEELHQMNMRCHDYLGIDSALDNNLTSRENNEYSEEEKKITDEINLLEQILFDIRGSQRNADGSIMTREDYSKPKQAEIKRLRKKSVKKTQEGA